MAKGKLNAVKTLYRETNNQGSLSSCNIDAEDITGYGNPFIYEYAFYEIMMEFFSKNEEWAKIAREKLHK